MNYGMKSSTFDNMEALASRAGAKITGAIRNAADKTGVGFSYLMQQASVESSFNTTAKAKGSSASGLYQFIDSTWLATVRDHGEKYGLGQYASQISANGTVSNRAVKQQILSLRNDPSISSAMAAEYAADNKQYLESTVGGEIGSTELYLAHFMGPGGAAKFLSKLQDNPNAIGAKSFAQAACSNKSVFYAENGKPRTMAEIYAFFDKKFDGTSNTTITAATSNNSSTYAQLDTKTKAALINAQFSSGRANIFDENTGSWFSTSNPKDVKWAQMASASTNGTIPQLQGALSNPVDIMQIVEMASLHMDSGRYNA
jgi:hypothetical protein